MPPKGGNIFGTPVQTSNQSMFGGNTNTNTFGSPANSSNVFGATAPTSTTSSNIFGGPSANSMTKNVHFFCD